ncbi:MAG: hypothetical protein WD557_16640 [Dehalococcoidia bacterium]
MKGPQIPVVLAFLVAAWIGACGGNGDEPPGGPTPFDDPTVQGEKFAELRASQEYQAAVEQMETCLSGQGYVGNPYVEGITLSDGTVYKATAGQGEQFSGAVLDFRIAQEQCRDQAGFEAVLQNYGLTSKPQGITPERLQQLNEDRVAVMQCMGGKGWEIPEPVTLQGTLVFDVVHDSDEREAAWNVDHAACNTELFGNIRGRE